MLFVAKLLYNLAALPEFPEQFSQGHLMLSSGLEIIKISIK